jgi:hypothetical protein
MKLIKIIIEVSDTDSCDIKDVFQKQGYYCLKEYDIEDFENYK